MFVTGYLWLLNAVIMVCVCGAVTDRWVNASVSVAPNGQQLLLSSPLPKYHHPHQQHEGSSQQFDNQAGQMEGEWNLAVAGTQYAFAPIPMMSAYDKGSDLPVLGWLAPLSANASDNVGNPSDSEGE